jgi:hypothetical protein
LPKIGSGGGRRAYKLTSSKHIRERLTEAMAEPAA